MTLTRMWKRVIAQGLCVGLFGLVIALSAESVQPGMDAPALACQEAGQQELVADQFEVEVRLPTRPSPGWRALIPGMTLPRT